jgi:hypothetical protein
VRERTRAAWPVISSMDTTLHARTLRRITWTLHELIRLMLHDTKGYKREGAHESSLARCMNKGYNFAHKNAQNNSMKDEVAYTPL